MASLDVVLPADVVVFVDVYFSGGGVVSVDVVYVDVIVSVDIGASAPVRGSELARTYVEATRPSGESAWPIGKGCSSNSGRSSWHRHSSSCSTIGWSKLFSCSSSSSSKSSNSCRRSWHGSSSSGTGAAAQFTVT